jgi:CxxC-x17-CxxC domain-containing protein
MISCLDCGQEFPFTVGEQEFYAQRGFTEAPKRCPGCRASRKAQRQSPAYGQRAESGGYGNGSNGGYSSFSGEPYTSSYAERRPREMFDATCADCGKTASVPFRPSGVRPVYCSDCFQARR